MKILFVASFIIGLVCQGSARSMGPMEILKQGANMIKVAVQKAQQEGKKFEDAIKDPTKLEENAANQIGGAINAATGLAQQEESKLQVDMQKAKQEVEAAVNHPEQFEKNAEEGVQAAEKDVEGFVKQEEKMLKEAIQNQEHAAEEAAKKAEGLTGTGLHRRSHKEAESSNVHSSKQEDLLKKLQVQFKVLVAKTIAMIKKISEKMSHY